MVDLTVSPLSESLCVVETVSWKNVNGPGMDDKREITVVFVQHKSEKAIFTQDGWAGKCVEREIY
jgi:hypothetical protein